MTDKKKAELCAELRKAAKGLSQTRKDLRAAEEAATKPEEIKDGIMKLCDLLDEAEAEAYRLSRELMKGAE